MQIHFLPALFTLKNSSEIILNPNCMKKTFIDHLKEKCRFDGHAFIDLCDESGKVANIHSKHRHDNIGNLLVGRATYIPVLVEKGHDEHVKTYLPLLVNWEKKYPHFEKILRQQTKEEKTKKTGGEGKSKRHRDRDKLSVESSTSRKSSMSTSSNESAQKPSPGSNKHGSKGSRKK